MLATRYNPNIQVRDFKNSFDLLNSMLDTMSEKKSFTSEFDFSPSINTREGESAYHIEVDLPGVNKESISLSIEDKKLIISGERVYKDMLQEENYHKIESRFGKFSRSFSLPQEIDIENIHAQSVDGVLEVVIPKLESALVEKVKKIKIR